MQVSRTHWLYGAVFAGLTLAGQVRAQDASPVTDAQLARIQHILVIYAENRSFDHLYGLFPGANGLANAPDTAKLQRDHDGSVLPFLTVWKDGKPDPRFARMPNGPFRIELPPPAQVEQEVLPSPIHAYFHNIEQIDGGRNDQFAAMSTVGGWTMAYTDGSRLRLWQWAKDYTLADNFFMGAFGGSFLNHQWLICACTPTFPDAPAAIRAKLDAQGRMLRKPDSPASATEGPPRLQVEGGGQVMPDGHAVNTSQPLFQPSGISPIPDGDPTRADPKGTEKLGPALPPQTATTIGDTLSEKGVSWAWYAGAWREALEDAPRAPSERKVIYTRSPGSPNFQPHHQPFNYFARFAPGTPDREEHLKDGEDLLAGIDAGQLPAVAFYKPTGVLTQHPSYTNLFRGDAHIADLLERIHAKPELWKDTLVIVTYDENGGFWDHVPPPTGPGWGDRWGPGTRIPTLIVSPFAKRGFIDQTSYDTTSILKLITRRFALRPLPGVRENAGDLTNALSFE